MKPDPQQSPLSTLLKNFLSKFAFGQQALNGAAQQGQGQGQPAPQPGQGVAPQGQSTDYVKGQIDQYMKQQQIEQQRQQMLKQKQPKPAAGAGVPTAGLTDPSPLMGIASALLGKVA